MVVSPFHKAKLMLYYKLKQVSSGQSSYFEMYNKPYTPSVSLTFSPPSPTCSTRGSALEQLTFFGLASCLLLPHCREDGY